MDFKGMSQIGFPAELRHVYCRIAACKQKGILKNLMFSINKSESVGRKLYSSRTCSAKRGLMAPSSGTIFSEKMCFTISPTNCVRPP